MLSVSVEEELEFRTYSVVVKVRRYRSPSVRDVSFRCSAPKGELKREVNLDFARRQYYVVAFIKIEEVRPFSPILHCDVDAPSVPRAA